MARAPIDSNPIIKIGTHFGLSLADIGIGGV